MGGDADDGWGGREDEVADAAVAADDGSSYASPKSDGPGACAPGLGRRAVAGVAQNAGSGFVAGGMQQPALPPPLQRACACAMPFSTP